ncbi:MAG: hypothetical protein [Microvirus sp.]|nr:MAG: hypothetical protein [Microvirus sp.]
MKTEKQQLKKRERKFTLQHEYELTREGMEFTTGPSMTVEGDAMSVQELVRRMNSGTMPAIAQDPRYYELEANHENLDMEKTANADIAFRHQLMEEAKESSDISRNQLKMFEAQKAEQREAEKQEKISERSAEEDQRSRSRKYSQKKQVDDQRNEFEETDIEAEILRDKKRR